MTSIYCSAELNYAAAMDLAPVATHIHNARLETTTRPWTSRGFELKAHESVVDFDDDDSIAATHYQEISELARELTGADAAIVVGHIKRDPAEAKKHADYGPIHFVHSDFAESYGDLIRERYRNETEEVGAALARTGITGEQAANAKRIVILQFWRNIGAANVDEPIAFCDCDSVPESDVFPVPVADYGGSGFNFDTLAIRAPSAKEHRWSTYPAMTRDEVVTFRTYDTDMIEKKGAFWTPHSAFRDPNVGSDAPKRASIELRASCFWF